MADTTSSIAGFIGNIADSAKDFVDEVLDRSANVDRDVRNSVGAAVVQDREAESPAKG